MICFLGWINSNILYKHGRFTYIAQYSMMYSMNSEHCQYQRLRKTLVSPKKNSRLSRRLLLPAFVWPGKYRRWSEQVSGEYLVFSLSLSPFPLLAIPSNPPTLLSLLLITHFPFTAHSPAIAKWERALGGAVAPKRPSHIVSQIEPDRNFRQPTAYMLKITREYSPVPFLNLAALASTWEGGRERSE